MSAMAMSSVISAVVTPRAIAAAIGRHRQREAVKARLGDGICEAVLARLDFGAAGMRRDSICHHGQRTHWSWEARNGGQSGDHFIAAW
jgi:hypothetical protein